jgi:nucleoid-associated protein YgaU
MLNKDEYNQDEYNDYYAQETRGAEISSRKNSGGSKKIVFIILLLLLIMALAYFGWKSMNSSKTVPTKIEKTDMVSEEIVTKGEKSVLSKEEQKEPAMTTQITKKVQNIVSTDSNDKMNPEDIANIVQMVMQKMNKDKNKELTSSQSTTSPSTTKPIEDSSDQFQDSKLLKSLSDSEVDSLSSISDDIDTIAEKDNNKKASNSDKPNTYNKVILDDKVGNSSDELSKLSDEISNVIDTEESKLKDNTNYTQSITKEAKTRKKEMRYITVKKGDTLGKIAKRAYGNVMEYKKIYEANPDIVRRPDKIYVGQRLRVPE